MQPNTPLNLAILDDYQNIAPAKFSHLKPHLTTITSFPETLHPKHNHADKVALISRLRPYQIISTMRERTPFPAELISSLPNLKYLLTTGTRNRSIDLQACAQRGILVTGTTGLRTGPVSLPSPSSTTEHTWALILGLARNIARDDAAVKSGGWQGSFAMGLAGKTLGILGLGSLGTATAKIGALAFGMRVIAWSSNLTQDMADEKASAFGLPAGTFEVTSSKLALFREADVLSVHYVLSERSLGIVREEELGVMKPTALLVNTSRGPLIQEKALLKTLKEGRIRGAALDVFDLEPLPRDSEWRSTRWGMEGRSEVLLSPHMGYAEEGIMNIWYEEQAENLERWLNGKEVENKLL
ncbi:glycerate dehydrogenase [[Emmonsia] crescens]|uniref:Glycerate dehydrogenase n=1 Tax=[Emmonsia] crescens TaxID=73230 RepID=A0A2B7ZMV8_9EURO|nr:glycerate dehydrogenase [Emmonsia crescens]